MGYGASASDRSYNERRSSEALSDMRRQAEPARPQPAPTPRAETRPQGSASTGPDTRSQGGSTWSDSRTIDYGRGSRSTGPAPQNYGGQNYGGQRNGGYFANNGWSQPAYAQGGSFGAWDAVFMWTMLSNLNRPGNAEFFRNQQDDPGYRQWRAEAERLSAQNADVRRQLNELDRQVSGRQAEPRDPAYLPPGVPREVALAAPVTQRAQPSARAPSVTEASSEGGGGGSLLGILFFLAIIGGLGFLAWRHFGNRQGSGSVARSESMASVATAAGILRHKATGEGSTPHRFRVGMAIEIDPTPFLLAQGMTKVVLPEGLESGGLTNVEAVGRFGGEGDFARLHLDDDHMLEVHVDSKGTPDECRYFSVIDIVTPADADEWKVWLESREGMIGWSEFQTHDGKSYARVWEPGPQWVKPRLRREEIATVDGSRTVTQRSMLYAAPTGAAAPAPEAEFILITAVEDGATARVEIRAGIEINVASISIP